MAESVNGCRLIKIAAFVVICQLLTFFNPAEQNLVILQYLLFEQVFF